MTDVVVIPDRPPDDQSATTTVPKDSFAEVNKMPCKIESIRLKVNGVYYDEEEIEKYYLSYSIRSRKKESASTGGSQKVNSFICSLKKFRI